MRLTVFACAQIVGLPHSLTRTSLLPLARGLDRALRMIICGAMVKKIKARYGGNFVRQSASARVLNKVACFSSITPSSII